MEFSQQSSPTPDFYRSHRKKVKLDTGGVDQIEPPGKQNNEPPPTFIQTSGNFPFLAGNDSEELKKTSIHTLEDIMENVSQTLNIKSTDIAKAEISPKNGLARILNHNNSLNQYFGEEIHKENYLFPVEALYLIENGKIEVCIQNIPISVEKARALFLHAAEQNQKKPYYLNFNNPFSQEPSLIKTCSIREYHVYKHLSKLGYRIRIRWQAEKPVEKNEPKPSTSAAAAASFSSTFQTTFATEIKCDDNDGDDEVVMMEFEDSQDSHKTLPITQEEVESLEIDLESQRLGIKRKVSEINSSGSLSPQPYAEGDEFQLVEYTVVEADSDIEFIEEVVSHPGVEIKEIPNDDDDVIFECEASTSRGPKPQTQTVCLISSESEDEDEANDLLSKFVPNTTVNLEFPGSEVLPPNIPARDNFLLTYHIKSQMKKSSDKSKVSDDKNIEDDIEGLKIDSPKSPSITRVKCDSWLEWRQLTMREAHNLLSDSLLGNQEGTSAHCVKNKLYLWPEENEDDGDSEMRDASSAVGNDDYCCWLNFPIPFNIYPQSLHGWHKNRLKSVRPSARVAVVSSNEEVGNFAQNSMKDDIPLVIAVVGREGGDIVFITPDNNPLPSNF